MPTRWRHHSSLNFLLPNGRFARFGTAPLVGAKTLPVKAEFDLKEKPKRAIANALFDVLARD